MMHGTMSLKFCFIHKQHYSSLKLIYLYTPFDGKFCLSFSVVSSALWWVVIYLLVVYCYCFTFSLKPNFNVVLNSKFWNSLLDCILNLTLIINFSNSCPLSLLLSFRHHITFSVFYVFVYFLPLLPSGPYINSRCWPDCSLRTNWVLPQCFIR